MSKLIFNLLFIPFYTLLIKPLFWVLYGISFWIIYAAIFGSILWAIRAATSVVVVWWIIGGTVGGVIGAIGETVLSLLIGEAIWENKKVGIALITFAWVCFWAFCWTFIFDFMAGMVELRGEELLWSLGVTASSLTPIGIFGATGGAIGGLLGTAINRFFAEE